MTVSTIRGAATPFLLLALSACGGGGGGSGGEGDTTTPVAETGFAQPGDMIRQNVTYTPKNVNTVISRDEGDTLEVVQDQPITVVFQLDGATEQAIVSFGGPGETFEGTSSGGVFTFTNESGGSSRLVRTSRSTNDAVELYRLTTNLRRAEGYPEGFAFVIGHDTNPAAVTAETGDATYRGAIQAFAVDANSTLWDASSGTTGSGNITLTANFDNNNISGSFDLGNFDGTTTEETYNIPVVDIVGNGFTGTFVVADGALAPGQSLANAEINGNFYGADVGAIGGTIFSEITQDGVETIYIQGAFIADVQPQ